MAHFRDEVLKLICGYKKITKRQLPQGEASKKFEKLGIKQRQLATASDISLYYTAIKILDNLNTALKNSHPTTYEHSGIVSLKEELNRILDEYIVQKHEVLNKRFTGSRAMLNAIQLINAPFSQKNYEKLEHNLNSIKSFGTPEQLAKIIQTLQNKPENYQPYLNQLIETYKNLPGSNITQR